MGARHLLCSGHSFELEIRLHYPHRFLNHDHDVFDCCGMAFSEEASLKPLIARVLNSISFGWHWPKSFRDFWASSVVVISTSGSTSPKVSRRIVGKGNAPPFTRLFRCTKNGEATVKSRDVARWVRCGLSVAGPFVRHPSQPGPSLTSCQLIHSAITAGTSRVAYGPLCQHAVTNTPAGLMELVRSYRSTNFGLPTKPGRVGSCISLFEACSDCYRVERTSSRAGLTPAVDHHLFTAHPVI
jgi:hypothetical protein